MDNKKYVEYKEISQIESICVRCEGQGITKIMFMNIPFYKDILVTSFECNSCKWRNNEVQQTSEISEFGIRYELKITKEEDMLRDIVKSGCTTIYIPELELEIPATGNGNFSTVEGLFFGFKEDLQQTQIERRKTNPEVAVKLDEFIKKLDLYINLDPSIYPFNLILDDPSGNSYIKNPHAPLKDNNLKETKYTRTEEQIRMMGFNPDNEEKKEKSNLTKVEDLNEKQKLEIENFKQNLKNKDKKQYKYTDKETDQIINKFKNIKTLGSYKLDNSKPLEETLISDDVVEIPENCFSCNKPGMFRMCTCSIPYFKEIIIMAFSCEFCGYKNNEVKVGGSMSEKAKKTTIKIKNENDLNRDVFKSDTCYVRIPEIDFEFCPYTLGSLYTTVEGLIDKILESLQGDNPFVGDSENDDSKTKFKIFLDKLENLKNGKTEFTLIFDDPLDNCFVYNPFYPNEDPNIETEIYDRTYEQNDEFGINDMKV